jgi:rubrerythrin
MAEKNLNMLDAIEIAMEAELKANKFYSDAVKAASNERGKDLLKQLANFELNHYKKLKELRNSLQKEGKFIEYKGTTFETFKSAHLSEASGKIEQNKEDVLHILSMAINAEKEANERYRKMADETTDPMGKEMFLKLADEETLHRRILSDEFYQLNSQGDIWIWGE